MWSYWGRVHFYSSHFVVTGFCHPSAPVYTIYSSVEVFTWIKKLLGKHSNDNLLLIGDMNMSCTDWLTMTMNTRSLRTLAQLFLVMCDRYSLFHFNPHPSTSVSGNILDVILSNPHSMVSKATTEAPTAHCDHFPLRALLDLSPQDTPEPVYKLLNLWRSG